LEAAAHAAARLASTGLKASATPGVEIRAAHIEFGALHLRKKAAAVKRAQKMKASGSVEPLNNRAVDGEVRIAERRSGGKLEYLDF
jgi:hypothetical protein